MNIRIKTITCALLVGTLAVPTAQAAEHSTTPRQRDASLVSTNAFANLGHEGSAAIFPAGSRPGCRAPAVGLTGPHHARGTRRASPTDAKRTRE
jgi:hypothetical protein